MINNIKKYILALSLFSAVVLGVLYLHDKYFSPEAHQMQYYSYEIYEPELLPLAKLNDSYVKKHQAKENNKSIIDELEKRVLPTENSGHSSGIPITHKNSGRGIYTSHRTTGSVPHGSGGAGTGSIMMGVSGKRGNQSSSISGSQLVQNPIAAPYHQYDGSNIILTDPGSDPKEANRIPVGNGLSFLLLAAAAYGLTMLFKTKKNALKYSCKN